MSKYKKQAAWYILATLGVILFLIPFHGFLTTWIGSNTGGLLIWRAWKEILLLPASFLAIYLICSDEKLRSYLWNNTLHKAMILASLWLVVVVLLKSRDIDALLLGSAIYLRLYVLYILCRIVVFYRPVRQVVIIKLLLIPTAGVVLFGLLQMFVLPHDFLKHFGYQTGVTIPPFFMIDRQMDALRIFSTTRGPNSLGVYLILPIMMLVAGAYKQLRQRQISARKLLVTCLLLTASLLVIYGSHSRSAWLGLLVAGAVFGWLNLPVRFKKLAVVAMISCISLLAVVTYAHKDTTFVQNVILHDNQQTGSPRSSNDERLEAWSRGVSDIAADPLLGCGVGCAGPASFHNEQGAKIAENQYLQAAQELGIIGAALFIAVLALTAYKLYISRDVVGAAMLSSFMGILVAGLFMHAWADDIVAYTWWIAFGLLLPSKVHYKYESQTYKKTA